MFNRRSIFKTKLSKEAIRQKLIGRNLRIHNLEFEVYESGDTIKIIPHTENDRELRTLPITHVNLSADTNNTAIEVSSKPRKIDIGGPYILIGFCIMFVALSVVYYVVTKGKDLYIPATMLGIALVVFGIFWYKMQMGYFDYIRKINGFVKSELA